MGVIYTNLSDPNKSSDSVNKSYVDNASRDVVLTNQTIDAAVSVGDVVKFDGTKWLTTDGKYPLLGLYIGDNNVLLKGKTNVFSTLTPNSLYYVDRTGNITSTQSGSLCLIGYSITASEFYFDYDFFRREFPLDRGVVSGSSYNNEFFSFVSLTKAEYYGKSSLNRTRLAGCSNGSNDRGLFGGGKASSYTNLIDYITISTRMNSVYFGDLLANELVSAGFSNGVNDQGIFGLIYSATSTIEHVTISTLGNSLYFGDVTVGRNYGSGSSNSTNDMGVFGGGYNNHNEIDYITISTPSNATDFGDLTAGRAYLTATSNSTNDRVVFAGGRESSTGVYDTIEYIDLPTPSNAASFGTLLGPRGYLYSTSNGVNERGVFGGGNDGTSAYNNTEYITISTLGNSAYFSDMYANKRHLSYAISNAI